MRGSEPRIGRRKGSSDMAAMEVSQYGSGEQKDMAQTPSGQGETK